MQKRFTVKIYDLAGTYIKTINPSQIMNEVTFSMKTGGGQGQCVLELNLPIDDFEEGTTVDDMNVVKIYESDPDNSPTPRLIYTGFVSQYTPFFQSGQEGVRLTLLGLVSMLSFGYYRDVNNYVITHTTQDPADILKAIIDHFQSIYTGGWIGYAGANIATVGTNVSYEFEQKKWVDAIKEVVDLTAEDWWWYIGADGDVYLQDRPATATHRLTIGYDVQEAEITKNNEKVVNRYRLTWGSSPTTTFYEDAASQAIFGVREKLETDSKVANSTTADQKGNKIIADYSDKKVEARIKVNTNYDIESIKPGHTVTVLNTKKGSNVLPANMLITSVQYTPDGVTLTLENSVPSLADNFVEAVEAVST